MSDIDEARLAFKAALANYYKSERDRTERCLGDIIDILGEEGLLEGDQVRAVLDRLTSHYAR